MTAEPLDPLAGEVLLARRRWALVRGESLRLLRSMPDACVDAVITDSPYSSGGQFRGDRMASPSEKYVSNQTKIERADFAGDNRDQRAFGYWCALWCAELLRIAKPGSPILLFTDWRQLPTTTDALQAGGWIWRGIVPWDKTEGCRPQKGRFAAQCEYVVWGSAGALSEDRIGGECLPGIVRQFPKPSEKNHIASKTPSTMAPLVKICERGGVILDPFAGGASGGVAALRADRRWIGFEISEANCEEARLAMEAEELAIRPRSMGIEQLPLLGGRAA